MASLNDDASLFHYLIKWNGDSWRNFVAVYLLRRMSIVSFHYELKRPIFHSRNLNKNSQSNFENSFLFNQPTRCIAESGKVTAFIITGDEWRAIMRHARHNTGRFARHWWHQNAIFLGTYLCHYMRHCRVYTTASWWQEFRLSSKWSYRWDGAPIRGMSVCANGILMVTPWVSLRGPTSCIESALIIECYSARYSYHSRAIALKYVCRIAMAHE